MKLPFIKFFAADYYRDTRVLSLATKGAWMDILCTLHGASTRGTMTLPLVGWARVISATVEQTDAVITELESMQVANVTRDSNSNVTITCRRMLRDCISREQTRLRVARHRGNEPCNAIGNASVTVQKLEAETRSRNQNTEMIAPSPAEPASEQASVALVFPTVGKSDGWPLTEAKVAEYRGTFPSLDVLAECKKALQWCRDNPARRKTERGMPKFIFAWLERSQNSSRGRAIEPAKQIVRIGQNISELSA